MARAVHTGALRRAPATAAATARPARSLLDCLARTPAYSLMATAGYTHVLEPAGAGAAVSLAAYTGVTPVARRHHLALGDTVLVSYVVTTEREIKKQKEEDWREGADEGALSMLCFTFFFLLLSYYVLFFLSFLCFARMGRGKRAQAKLEYLGPEPGGNGRWVAGVALAEAAPRGHDGLYQGHRLFFCTPGHGLVLRLNRVKPEQPEARHGPFALTVTRSDDKDPLRFEAPSYWELQQWVFVLSQALTGDTPTSLARLAAKMRSPPLLAVLPPTPRSSPAVLSTQPSARSSPLAGPTPVYAPRSSPPAEPVSLDQLPPVPLPTNLPAHVFTECTREQSERLLRQSAVPPGGTAFLCRYSRGHKVVTVRLPTELIVHAVVEADQSLDAQDVAALLTKQCLDPSGYVSAHDLSLHEISSDSES